MFRRVSDGTLLNSISDGFKTLPEYSECAQGTFGYGGGTDNEDGKLSGNINSHSLAPGKRRDWLTINTAFSEEDISLDDDLRNLALEEHTPAQ